MVKPKGSMSTEGEILQVSVLPYRCSICPALIKGLTSAASPRVDISSTCKVGQKLEMSLPLLTCSPSAWPSRLLYRRGWKSRRDLWITCVCVCVCVYVCVHMYVCVCMCVYIYIYICICICTLHVVLFCRPDFYLLLHYMAELLVQKTVTSMESFTSFKLHIFSDVCVWDSHSGVAEIQVFWDVTLFSQNKSVALCHMSHHLQFLQYGCLRRGPE